MLNLLYKAEKPSVRLQFLVAWISAMDARIDVKLARNEAPVLGLRSFFLKFKIAKQWAQMCYKDNPFFRFLKINYFM